MKKIIALLLAAIMVLGLAACASKTGNTEASDVKNVVYIVNGNLGDKSFFDSAQAGINKLIDDGRITCDTISDTVGSALPNRASELALSMQAAYDENHRNTLASMQPEHAP